MTRNQLSEQLAGKVILKINYKETDSEDLCIESISLTSGELLTLTEPVALSHPEQEEELAEFYRVLKNVPPSGLITFKAKYLSRGLIEREISATHKAIKSNGYGLVKTNREGYLSYRFDMPEN